MTDFVSRRDSPPMTSSGSLPGHALGLEPEASTGAGLCLAQVYEAHFKYVWRCLRSLGVPDPSLDDSVQEVFLVVQRKLEQFDGGCHLRTWLYAIVLRVARRQRSLAARDARRFLSRDEAAGQAQSGVSPRHPPDAGAGDLRHEVEKNEQLELAQRALTRLDDTKREVFVLACIEGMSAPEIAQIASIPVNTVYSRLRAARQAFASAVSELQGLSATPTEGCSYPARRQA